jgi:hypothetical protein
MLPEAKNEDLIYVSNANGTVSVYRYWKRKLVGVLHNFAEPWGECVDRENNVYITDPELYKVFEYAHGGKKSIRTISDGTWPPFGCAVDVKGSGDLAVANYFGYSQKGNIAIYRHARGKPSFYGLFNVFQSCAYDDSGTLLATDGLSDSYTSDFAILRRDGTGLREVEITGGSSYSGGFIGVRGIAWDGKNWVVNTSQYGGAVISRISIEHGSGHVVGTTMLAGDAGVLGQLAIYFNTQKQATQVVGAAGYERGDNLLAYWKYPFGGIPLAEATKGLDQPFGVAISYKQQR